MFDLEKQIAEWRRQLAAAGIKSTETLNELESHLREDVAQQIRAGVDVQRAFEAAVQRLGRTELLRSEFGKVAGPRGNPSVSWEQQTVFFVLLPVFLPYFVYGLCEMSPAQRLWGLGAMAAIIFMTYSAEFLVKMLLTIRNQRRTKQIATACSFFGMGWLAVFLILLPRLDLVMGPLIVAILWALVVVMGFVVVIPTALGHAARGQTAATA